MTTSKKDYTKNIIEEYNLRLQSWGDSDSWGLTEFKMLEDLINEASNTRINANTLKRFFHQKTSNPQVATYNALCMFLGYSSYAEFIIKKTKQTQTQNEDNINIPTNKEQNEYLESKKEEDVKGSKSPKKPSSHKRPQIQKYSIIGISLLIVGIVSFFLYGYWNSFQQKYEEKLLSNIIFKSTIIKGASPFTTKIEYYIPQQLADSLYLTCIEANGDRSSRKIPKDKTEIYASFIYSGKGICQLTYKGKVLKDIEVESRMSGWSVYLKEERNNFYLALPFSQTNLDKNHLTLPLKEIPESAITDKLFVSYTYYQDSIIDGDNFIFEARVRNSTTEDHGVPCNDIMMYIFSNTGLHGFALNENCYSYLKFISSENTIMGDQHDLSRLNFNPELWHTMKIEVKNKKTNFYLDDKIVNQMSYKQSLGIANELTLRFKGCGAVDYVRVMDTNHKVFYEKFFRKTDKD